MTLDFEIIFQCRESRFYRPGWELEHCREDWPSLRRAGQRRGGGGRRGGEAKECSLKRTSLGRKERKCVTAPGLFTFLSRTLATSLSERRPPYGGPYQALAFCKPLGGRQHHEEGRRHHPHFVDADTEALWEGGALRLPTCQTHGPPMILCSPAPAPMRVQAQFQMFKLTLREQTVRVAQI